MYVGGADSPTTDKSYRELSKLGAGASFGEKALINDDVRGASVKVTSDDAELFYLNRSHFNELLGEFIFGYFWVIFGYFWLFLVILGYSWLFLVTFVWAIVLTVCFVYRLVRRNLALAAASPRSRVVLGFRPGDQRARVAPRPGGDTPGRVRVRRRGSRRLHVRCGEGPGDIPFYYSSFFLFSYVGDWTDLYMFCLTLTGARLRRGRQTRGHRHRRRLLRRTFVDGQREARDASGGRQPILVRRVSIF